MTNWVNPNRATKPRNIQSIGPLFPESLKYSSNSSSERCETSTFLGRLFFGFRNAEIFCLKLLPYVPVRLVVDCLA